MRYMLLKMRHMLLKMRHMLLKRDRHNFGVYLCRGVTVRLVAILGFVCYESYIEMNEVDIK